MSKSFETVRYSENAMKKADLLLLEAFQARTGAQPSLPRSPFWLHRKVCWEEIPGREHCSRKDYLVEIIGVVVISADENTMPSPWPNWAHEVRIRLTMIPTHRGHSWLCKKAVGMLENKTMIKYSYDKELLRKRRAVGLPT